jgi:hypothetical protein
VATIVSTVKHTRYVLGAMAGVFFLNCLAH